MSESDSGISKNAPALNAGIKSDKIPILQIDNLYFTPLVDWRIYSILDTSKVGKFVKILPEENYL